VGAMQQEKSLLEQARQLAKEAQVRLLRHTGWCCCGSNC
jgi:hypothetical protein